jgi:catechol 2,3-dioxygenase-like lactoylglutathione lyase family enzyme
LIPRTGFGDNPAVLVGIHHTALSPRDLDRLVAFYRDAFGFEVEFDFPWDASNEAFRRTHAVEETTGRVVMLARGDHRIEIFQYEKPVPRPDVPGRRNADLGISHLCFQVEDLDGEVERLRAAGMVFQSPPVAQTPDISNCYGRDPDGNLIELIEFRA